MHDWAFSWATKQLTAVTLLDENVAYRVNDAYSVCRFNHPQKNKKHPCLILVLFLSFSDLIGETNLPNSIFHVFEDCRFTTSVTSDTVRHRDIRMLGRACERCCGRSMLADHCQHLGEID